MSFVTARRLVRTVVVAAALVLAPLPFQTPAAATPHASDASKPLVVTYDNEPPLGNASVMTLAGTRTGGGCSFRFPELRLAPTETALESRQIETNFTDCTTKIETGVPPATVETQTDGTSESEVAKPDGGKPATGDGGMTVSAVSSSGYYRFWWEDVIHLRVHEVKSNISWVWNGSCVTASSGSADYWWLSGSGWLKHSSGVWINRLCSSAKVYSDATYRNGAFCWPGSVWSYYDNVSAQGRADGWLVGWVDGSWNTYPFACPTLHYHYQLRRVTG